MINVLSKRIDMKPSAVLNFWFKEIKPSQAFIKDPNFDKEIKERFGKVLEAARNNELFTWRDTIHGRLAEIIVLDQFSRNVYRDTPAAFSHDAMALALSFEALRFPEHKDLTSAEKLFLYMPFMHSESKIVHEEAVKLFSEEGLEEGLDYELRHKVIIDRFGRYPHRNQILGRESTKEELEFLEQPDSSF